MTSIATTYLLQPNFPLNPPGSPPEISDHSSLNDMPPASIGGSPPTLDTALALTISQVNWLSRTSVKTPRTLQQNRINQRNLIPGQLSQLTQLTP